jgi:hypothetical protein
VCFIKTFEINIIESIRYNCYIIGMPTILDYKRGRGWLSQTK